MIAYTKNTTLSLKKNTQSLQNGMFKLIILIIVLDYTEDNFNRILNDAIESEKIQEKRDYVEELYSWLKSKSKQI